MDITRIIRGAPVTLRAQPADRNVTDVKDIKKRYVLSLKEPLEISDRLSRIKEVEREILTLKLYDEITPKNTFTGEFLVSVGRLDVLREIATQHGFGVMELIEV